MKKYKIAVTPHEFCRKNQCNIYRDSYVMTFDAVSKKQAMEYAIEESYNHALQDHDDRDAVNERFDVQLVDQFETVYDYVTDSQAPKIWRF
tara:strand:+ start:113 stop:385 length:273 start_codon:yes stop_codon:yes gene_type:complete